MIANLLGGLANFVGGGSAYPMPIYNPFQGYNPYPNLQQFVPCKHGADCPMCRENAQALIEYNIEQETIKIKKAEDYKNRCKEYMDKFRGITR